MKKYLFGLGAMLVQGRFDREALHYFVFFRCKNKKPVADLFFQEVFTGQLEEKAPMSMFAIGY